MHHPTPDITASPTTASGGRPRNRRPRRAGALIEMALVMPILLSVCFGVVEYGDYFYVKNTIQSAVNAGCRAGAASGSLNTDVTTAVSKMMSASGFSASTYTTSILDSSGNALDLSTVASNVTFQVKVTANWSTIGIHVLPSSLGGIATSKQVICTASMNTD